MNLENQNLSSGLREFVTKHEGYRNKPYKDVAGKWTIGIGHLIKPGEKHLLDPKGISDDEVIRLFSSDIAWALKAVNDRVKVPLTNNQTIALTSFVFNFGPGAFASSTLLRKLNASFPLADVGNEFLKWVYASNPDTGKKEVVGGLVSRRKDEMNKFLS